VAWEQNFSQGKDNKKKRQGNTMQCKRRHGNALPLQLNKCFRKERVMKGLIIPIVARFFLPA
jgi:hypothetical protein